MNELELVIETGNELVTEEVTFDLLISGARGPKGEKGDTGDTGPTGPTGPGVPSGGVFGDLIRKLSGTDYDLGYFSNKLDATVDPAVGNDSSEGYSVQSMWLNITDQKAFICLDASVGAAVWSEITGGGGESSEPGELIATRDLTAWGSNVITEDLATLQALGSGPFNDLKFVFENVKMTAGVALTLSLQGEISSVWTNPIAAGYRSYNASIAGGFRADNEIIAQGIGGGVTPNQFFDGFIIISNVEQADQGFVSKINTRNNAYSNRTGITVASGQWTGDIDKIRVFTSAQQFGSGKVHIYGVNR